MGSLNRVTLIGNLGHDPEVKFSASGQAVCKFSIATSEKWTDKDGKPVEKTEWHRIVAFGKTGENCGEYLSKGKPVCVEGKISSNEYTDKNNVKRTSFEIVASRVIFLGSKDGGAKSEPAEPGPTADLSNKPANDEDVPF